MARLLFLFQSQSPERTAPDTSRFDPCRLGKETVRDHSPCPTKKAPAQDRGEVLGGRLNQTDKFQMASHCSTGSGAL
jgi:hypothetical protein